MNSVTDDFTWSLCCHCSLLWRGPCARQMPACQPTFVSGSFVRSELFVLFGVFGDPSWICHDLPSSRCCCKLSTCFVSKWKFFMLSVSWSRCCCFRRSSKGSLGKLAMTSVMSQFPCFRHLAPGQSFGWCTLSTAPWEVYGRSCVPGISMRPSTSPFLALGSSLSSTKIKPHTITEKDVRTQNMYVLKIPACDLSDIYIYYVYIFIYCILCLFIYV